MKITVDTNLLVRAAVRDHPGQTEVAMKEMGRAELLALALPCLCEFAWVLRSVYGFRPTEIGIAIRAAIAAGNVETNRPAVEAGLAMLDAGGDFADGAIAHEGQWLGADTFVSFDAKAVKMLTAQGVASRVL